MFLTDYKLIQVRPVTGAIGAEVSGVNLSEPMDDAQFAEVRRAWLEHLVLIFRDQPMTHEQLEAFTLRFGRFGHSPFIEPLADHPHIIEVRKNADDRGSLNFGGAWHSDWSFQPEPPSATLLHAKVVPPWGGDTLFANMYLAYENLPEELRARANSLAAVHSARMPYGSQGIYSRPVTRSMVVHTDASGDEETEHPLVRTHPETGRKCLFINPVYTLRLVGLDQEESALLVRELQEGAVSPPLTCRLRWAPDTLAIWDNRCTQHWALNDYEGFERVLHRTVVAGSRPH